MPISDVTFAVAIAFGLGVFALVVALAVSTWSLNPGDWWARLREWVLGARAFFEECLAELRKVHWPTWEETRAATIAVIIGVVVVGVYLGLLDSVLSFVFTRVLS
jgi:preprotein translocase subunit SecE